MTKRKGKVQPQDDRPLAALYFVELERTGAYMLEMLTKEANKEGYRVSVIYAEKSNERGLRIEREKLIESFQFATWKKLFFWTVTDFFLWPGGATNALRTLYTLQSYGLQYRSQLEPAIQTYARDGNRLICPFIEQIGFKIGEMDKMITGKRITEGIDRAKSEGVQLGRPWKIRDWPAVEEMRTEGMSYQEISRKTGIPKTSISRHFRTVKT